MLTPIAKGSKVGIIAPSSSLNSPEEIRDGLRYLENLGYRVVLGKYVYENQNHMAGTPEQRAEDIMNFFADKEIKAIFAACGGYGSQYILPLLNYDVIKQNPKPIIGFSDTTALQTGIYTLTGNISYAGILLKYDFDKHNIHPYTDIALQAALNGKINDIKSGDTVNPGVAEGKLIGTNLCVLELLAGTPYYPNLNDSILLLEDVDDKTYRFERMLLQLHQHKQFSGVRGIIFGQFNDLSLNHPDDKDMNQIIDEFAAAVKIPVMKNFQFGHVRARQILPLGADVRLNATNCVLEIRD